MLRLFVSFSPQSQKPIPSLFSLITHILQQLLVVAAFRFSQAHWVFVALKPISPPRILAMASDGEFDRDPDEEDEQQREYQLAVEAARLEFEQVSALESEPFADSGCASSSTDAAPPAIVTSLSLSTTVESTPRDPTRKL